jgi:HEAT repeat protein
MAPEEDLDRPRLDRALLALVEGDFYERWQAIAQLKTLGPSVIPALVALLADETVDLEQCWFVARALGEFDDPLAVRSLVGLMSMAPDPAVQAAAAEALGKVADRSPTLRSAALDQLRDGLADPQLGPIVLRAIAQIQHPEAIDLLLAAARSPDETLRAAAIGALGGFLDRRVPPLLAAALADPALTVRLEAAAALGAKAADVPPAQQPGVVAGLAALLEDAATATVAAAALGRWGDDRAVAALATAWDRGSAVTAVTLARTLARIGSRAALAALSDRLPHSDQDCLLEGIRAIGQHPALNETDQLRAADLLLDWLDQAGDPFADPTVRGAIVEALGNLGAPSAFDRLLPGLAQAAPDALRWQILAALRQIDPTTGLDRLAAWVDRLATPQGAAPARQALDEWRAIALAQSNAPEPTID